MTPRVTLSEAIVCAAAQVQVACHLMYDKPSSLLQGTFSWKDEGLAVARIARDVVV